MSRSVVLFVAYLALAAIVLTPTPSIAGDEPAPGQVADWWQWGDQAMKERAATVVAKASPEFLRQFQKALWERRGNPTAAADRFIDRALAGDENALTLLQGMGRPAIERLLYRIRDPEKVPLPIEPFVLGLPTPPTEPVRHQVLVHAKVYTLPRGGAAALLGSARSDGIHLLDASEAKTVDRQVARSRTIEVASAPRLLIEDREWGTIQTVEPVAYVREYRVEKRGDSRIADPVIDTVKEGLLLEVRPVVSTDGRFLTLEGSVTQMRVKRPIATKRVALPGLPDDLEVQTPTVAESKLDLHVTLPRGGAVVGAGIPHPADATKELLVLVRASLVDPAEFANREIAEARAESQTVINVDVRAIEASPAALRLALGGAVPTADRPSLTLDAAQILALLGPKREGAEGVRILHAPSLTAYDGQACNVSVVNQISYVQDFDLKVAKDGSQMADPVIGVIQEGLLLELRPRVSRDRKAIRLDAEATWADLIRPIPDFKTTIGKPPQEVTIQLPELTVAQVKDDCRVAPGQWVLLGGLGEGPNGRRFILLHAQVLRLEEAGKKER